jgi:hypothetical protein
VFDRKERLLIEVVSMNGELVVIIPSPSLRCNLSACHCARHPTGASPHSSALLAERPFTARIMATVFGRQRHCCCVAAEYSDYGARAVSPNAVSTSPFGGMLFSYGWLVDHCYKCILR